MRSQKGSRRIVVSEVEYRWRATGDDGHISIGIWPTNNIGPYIHGNLRYHETWIDNGDGSSSSSGNQIVVTNRIIRRIIEHAKASFGYDPQGRGKELNLRVLDDVVVWSDTVRGKSSN
jgi:hypothetical protein